jgi:hypothetical protein
MLRGDCAISANSSPGTRLTEQCPRAPTRKHVRRLSLHQLWDRRNRHPCSPLLQCDIGADAVTLTNSPLLGTSQRSEPYVIWRWVPDGPQYVIQIAHDPASGTTRETIRLDAPEDAILGMTPDGKFMVVEVVRSPIVP